MSAGNTEDRGPSMEAHIPIRTVLVDDFFRWCECVCLQHSVYSNPFDRINDTVRMAYMFRGQADADWPVESSFRRTYCDKDGFQVDDDMTERYLRIKELEISANFMRDAYCHLDHPPCDMVEWFSLMRHYGAPTRIVDFTTSPFVALHFAVSSNDGRDCAVWAFPMEDAWQVRRQAAKSFNSSSTGDRTKRYAATIMKKTVSYLIDWELDVQQKTEYVNRILGRTKKGDPVKCSRNNASILIIKPRYSNPRISAQAGLLVVPTVLSMSFMENAVNGYISLDKWKGKDEDGVIRISDNNFVDLLGLHGSIIKFVFPVDVCNNARAFLSAANISAKTLFPDINGVSQQFGLRQY